MYYLIEPINRLLESNCLGVLMYISKGLEVGQFLLNDDLPLETGNKGILLGKDIPEISSLDIP